MAVLPYSSIDVKVISSGPSNFEWVSEYSFNTMSASEANQFTADIISRLESFYVILEMFDFMHSQICCNSRKYGEIHIYPSCHEAILIQFHLEDTFLQNEDFILMK